MSKISTWGAWLKKRAQLLKREVFALFYAYKDSRTPWYARAFAAFIVASTLSPIDLIPDFIPVLGYLDDLILTPLYVSLALKMIPAEVMVEARRKAEEQMGREKPVNWVYAGFVIVIWLGLAYVIFRAVWGLLAHR